MDHSDAIEPSRVSRSSFWTTIYKFILSVPVVRGLFLSRAVCDLSCVKNPEKGAPIFVTVHGTWRTTAPWTRTKSKLVAKLLKEWPGAGIYRFKWSGTNGIRQRLVASEILCEGIDDTIKQHPLSNVVLIAHSHGGNVVAWAATQINHTLAAAVYLNTPFIQVLRTTTDFFILRLMLYFWGTVFGAPWTIVVPSLLFASNLSGRFVSFLVTLALFVSGLVLLRKVVPPRVEALRDQIASVSSGKRRVSRELVVFVVGDEPSSAFGALYFGQWLNQRITFVVSGIMLLSLPFIWTRVFSEGIVNRIGPFLVGLCVVGYFGSLFLGTCAYGLVQALIALDSPVTTTPFPVGQTECVAVPWSTKDGPRHFLVYNSPKAIAAIVIWLKSTLSPRKIGFVDCVPGL
jgi:pimeloyl-ACP methyl ester carboxylesterase